MGYKIYGTPWTSTELFGGFHVNEGIASKEKFALIPADTDLLLTHTPAFGQQVIQLLNLNCLGMLDKIGKKQHGSKALAYELATRVKPQYHIFGHIHEQQGARFG